MKRAEGRLHRVYAKAVMHHVFDIFAHYGKVRVAIDVELATAPAYPIRSPQARSRLLLGSGTHVAGHSLHRISINAG